MSHLGAVIHFISTFAMDLREERCPVFWGAFCLVCFMGVNFWDCVLHSLSNNAVASWHLF